MQARGCTDRVSLRGAKTPSAKEQGSGDADNKKSLHSAEVS